MRQHLTEQMSYLKKDKDMFVTQKTELEQNSQAKTEIAEEPKDMSKSSGMLASGAKWYFLNDGLSVINENPFITSKPLLGKLGDIKDALAASLFSSGNGSRNRPPGHYAGSMNNQYGPPPGQQYYEPSHYRGGPNMDQGPRQSMDFYHNDASSFVRR